VFSAAASVFLLVTVPGSSRLRSVRDDNREPAGPSVVLGTGKAYNAELRRNER